eukprot:Hpha_TRINITY_DN15487_c3_g1::TRINITY_DN15487_c3_g1_i2::g.177349::m.177349
MRHIVRGPWLGVRESAADAAPPAEVTADDPPGGGLETWQATTIASAGLVAAAERKRASDEGARAVVYGLGDCGAVSAFLAASGGLHVDAADPSRAVVRAVEEQFTCESSREGRKKGSRARRNKHGGLTRAELQICGLAGLAPLCGGASSVLIVSPPEGDQLPALQAAAASVPPPGVIAVACRSRAEMDALAEAGAQAGLAQPLRLLEYKVEERPQDEDDEKRADGGAKRYETGDSAVPQTETEPGVLVWGRDELKDTQRWLHDLGYGEQNATMPVPLAQKSAAVRIPHLLSAEEISEVIRVVGEHKDSLGVEQRSPLSDAWKVWFLHTGGAMARILPWVRERILSAARKVDAEQGWNLLPEGDDCRLRVAEFHDQTAPGPGIPDPLHLDQDSLITIDIMLSDPGADFDGGVFTTEEVSGPKNDYVFNKGDAVAFVSHKYHCVAPVTRGRRRVMVLEFWRGPERSCPHRCETVAGPCPRDRAFPPPPMPPGGGDGVYPALPFRLGVVQPLQQAFRVLWQGVGDRLPEPPTQQVPPVAERSQADTELVDELFG